VPHQRFSYTYDAPIQTRGTAWSWCRRAARQPAPAVSPITVSATSANHHRRRRRQHGDQVLRAGSAGPIEFVVARVERIGPDSDVLPAAALTHPAASPTRLTAANAAIRTHAARMAGTDPWPPPSGSAPRARGDQLRVRRDVRGHHCAEALASGHGVRRHRPRHDCCAGRRLRPDTPGHLVGEGATHAWSRSLLTAGARAAAFDPSTGGRVGRDHLTVATSVTTPMWPDLRDLPRARPRRANRDQTGHCRAV
jgi:hypothetical protein